LLAIEITDLLFAFDSLPERSGYPDQPAP